MSEMKTVFFVDYKLVNDKYFMAYDERRWAEEHIKRYVPPYEQNVLPVAVAVEQTKPPFWSNTLWFVRDSAGKIDFASYSRNIAIQWADDRIKTHRFAEEALLNTMLPSMELGLTHHSGVKHRHERGAIHPQALAYHVDPSKAQLSVQSIDENSYFFSVFAPDIRSAMRIIMDAETPVCTCMACIQIRDLYC